MYTLSFRDRKSPSYIQIYTTFDTVWWGEKGRGQLWGAAPQLNHCTWVPLCTKQSTGWSWCVTHLDLTHVLLPATALQAGASAENPSVLISDPSRWTLHPGLHSLLRTPAGIWAVSSLVRVMKSQKLLLQNALPQRSPQRRSSSRRVRAGDAAPVLHQRTFLAVKSSPDFSLNHSSLQSGLFLFQYCLREAALSWLTFKATYCSCHGRVSGKQQPQIGWQSENKRVCIISLRLWETWKHVSADLHSYSHSSHLTGAELQVDGGQGMLHPSHQHSEQQQLPSTQTLPVSGISLKLSDLTVFLQAQ